MQIVRLRYEWKIARKGLLAAPALALAPVGLLVLTQRLIWHQRSDRVLLAAAEMLLPVAAALVLVALLAHDDTLELHLTLPRSYASTGLLRAALIGVWMAGFTCALLSAAYATGLVPLPPLARTFASPVRYLAVQLVWAAPLAALCAVALCLALVVKQRAAAGALMGGIWLLDILFTDALAHTTWLRPALLFPATLLLYPAAAARDYDIETYWLATRLELLVVATGLVFMGWLLLRDTEGMFARSE